MSSRRYRPRRRLRNELLPLAMIASLPVALYLAFPSGAIGFVPSERQTMDSSYSAFVCLESEREAKLLKDARSSWQSDSASRRGVRANLLSCGEESVSKRIASGLRPRSDMASEAVVEYECDVIPAGLAAESPKMLPVDRAQVPDPVFSKSDLLKLN